jgi:hypothetical protein
MSAANIRVKIRYPNSRDAVAVHEIGHAAVQAVLGLGPRHVTVTRAYCMDGSETWEGETELLVPDPEECNLVKAWVMQMAGAIAQINIKPESLGEVLQAEFKTEWINPCLKWHARPKESDLYQKFASLGWDFDYDPFNRYKFIPGFFNERFHRSKPDNWRLFFASEQILYRAFADSLVRAESLKIAKYLESQPASNEGTQTITSEQFLSEGRDLLLADAWDELRSIDLGNP